MRGRMRLCFRETRLFIMHSNNVMSPVYIFAAVAALSSTLQQVWCCQVILQPHQHEHFGRHILYHYRE